MSDKPTERLDELEAGNTALEAAIETLFDQMVELENRGLEEPPLRVIRLDDEDLAKGYDVVDVVLRAAEKLRAMSAEDE